MYRLLDDNNQLGYAMRAQIICLGHYNIESTVRYLGVEVDDALDLAERIE